MQRLQLEVRLCCELVESAFAGRIGFTASAFSSSAPTAFERTIYPDGLSILTHQAACCTPQLFVGGWDISQHSRKFGSSTAESDHRMDDSEE